MGANGFVVAGTFSQGGAFHWMPTSGVSALGGRQADAVSRDGKTVVGRALDARGFENAAICTGGQTWRTLGGIGPAARDCQGLLSAGYDVSNDGRVIVGLARDGCGYARAFRWDESSGMLDLGSLGGYDTRATGVSGDGRVVVGFEQAANGFRQGAKWVDGREELIQGRSGVVGEAYAASRDGSLIVGTNCDPSSVLGGRTAWSWAPATGVSCHTVELPAWVPSFPYSLIMEATSDDGRLIGGALSFGLDAEAVVWLDGEGVLLRDYLRANGVRDAFDGWFNTGFVTDVSADGRTLVGYGAGPRDFQGYVVVLPE